MHVMANEMRMDVRQQHDAAMYLKLTSEELLAWLAIGLFYVT